ncbi:putative trna-specific adenosine deaminase-like protein [Eutypa lata UCREL1]|uniref:Putative trna-specific adenosine deaminase-like protein n=1 Tax=Eutypa lata (strain UCR-EL1) TaxID=1287681 RepID=M7T5V6_EUTLA|nr:putative trna-specific adenosine deaminase-like protein [Eutypa lata UCREL1]
MIKETIPLVPDHIPLLVLVQVPVPAVAAAPVISNQHGDTRPNDSRNQSDAHKLNGSRRGGGGGGIGNGNGAPRNHGRSSPTTKQQQSVVAAADRKENLAPSTSKDVTPQATPSSKGAPTVTKTVAPLTTSVNRAQAQTQKPGLNGNVTAPGSGPVSAPASSIVKPKTQESNPPNVQVDQLRTAIAGLTFDETPAAAPTPTKALDQGSVGTDTAATAARKGSAPPTLPVPVVVPFPGTRQQQQQQHKHATVPPPNLPGLIDPKTEEEQKERDYHLKFMNEALDMLALDTNETPVGCVLVYHGRIIAKGMNATNVTRNGTRHAEFMALSALFSRREAGDIEGDVNSSPALDDACWGDVDPRDGHIFPYGQKLHPAPVVDRSIVSECVLYVTVEPCVMCASLLRQLGIRKVYFGAVNDKFGGTGGVFRIHLNSKAVPVPKPEEEGRPYQNGYGPSDVGRIARGRTTPLLREEDDGDGGNVEPGYPVEGGYFRDKAVALLRHFYVQENGRAPQPRKKEGRAARLFAMEAAAKGGSASEMSDTATLPDTPVDNEPLPVGGGGGGSEKLDPTPTPVALSTDAPDSL